MQRTLMTSVFVAITTIVGCGADPRTVQYQDSGEPTDSNTPVVDTREPVDNNVGPTVDSNGHVDSNAPVTDSNEPFDSVSPPGDVGPLVDSNPSPGSDVVTDMGTSDGSQSDSGNTSDSGNCENAYNICVSVCQNGNWCWDDHQRCERRCQCEFQACEGNEAACCSF